MKSGSCFTVLFLLPACAGVPVAPRLPLTTHPSAHVSRASHHFCALGATHRHNQELCRSHPRTHAAQHQHALQGEQPRLTPTHPPHLVPGWQARQQQQQQPAVQAGRWQAGELRHTAASAFY